MRLVLKAEVKTHAMPLADIGALVVCSLIWGTTWRAIKLQLGVVPPLDSVVYRFAIAAALLFAGCALSRRSLALTRRQHLALAAQGVATFALQYGLVYRAEETVPSGAMAVIFAAIPFLSLALFRLVFARRASPLAWIAMLMGLLGVAIMSASQSSGGVGAAGVLLALAGVVAAVAGNLFAFRAQSEGAGLAPGLAWAMGYGAAALALFQLVTRAPWRFDPSLAYAGSLAYLALFGSVIAFLVYYGLARRRGFPFASYVAALTPPIAMIISAMTEATRWGVAAGAGVALVLAGQVLLIRASRA